MSNVPTTAVAAVLAIAVFGCGDDSGRHDDCALPRIAPGIGNVVAGPRADVVAEVLALTCSDAVAAPAELYESLAADLAAVVAVDPRMRLDVVADRNQWPYLYSFDPVLAHPPALFTLPNGLAAGRALLDQSSCAHALTDALHGTASEKAGTNDSFIEVDFANRLDAGRITAAYARLGIPFETVEQWVEDGPRASFRDVPGGREYLLELRGGDCPAGCTFSRTFWWRVLDGQAELLAEFGMSMENGGPLAPAPAALDLASFRCATSTR